jgi:hypothetical protein
VDRLIYRAWGGGIRFVWDGAGGFDIEADREPPVELVEAIRTNAAIIQVELLRRKAIQDAAGSEEYPIDPIDEVEDQDRGQERAHRAQPDAALQLNGSALSGATGKV